SVPAPNAHSSTESAIHHVLGSNGTTPMPRPSPIAPIRAVVASPNHRTSGPSSAPRTTTDAPPAIVNTTPIAAASTANVRSMYSPSTAGIPVNDEIARKYTPSRTESGKRVIAASQPRAVAASPRRHSRSGRAGGSESSRIAATAFNAHRPAATNPGTPRPYWAKYPPIDGPTMMPSADAAPIQPRPRARSPAAVVSAT